MAISSMLVELERGAMHDVPQNDEPPNDEPQEAKISPAVLRVRRASKNEMEPLEQNEARLSRAKVRGARDGPLDGFWECGVTR